LPWAMGTVLFAEKILDNNHYSNPRGYPPWKKVRTIRKK